MTNQNKVIKEFVFDPRMLISPPFTKCPKCQQITFGILSINRDHYDKRCKNCMYPNPRNNEGSWSVSLPKISKKVIYIDQMAISNMMKVLNPNSKSHNKVDKIWLSLFELLDKLCKMQLIICPSSDIHREESSLSPYYDSVKKMYDLLSGGVKFTNELNLKVQQVLSSLGFFLDNQPFSFDIIDHDSAFHDDIHGWQDRIILTVEFNTSVEQIAHARRLRDKTSEGFNEIFANWQQSKKTFKEFFEIEEKASSEIILNDYFDFFQKLLSASESDRTNIIFDAIQSPRIYLFNIVHSRIAKKYPDALEALQVTINFFNSTHFRNIPSQQISAYLFAGIARKASQGQKRVPSKGMLNDIGIISNYLPFCDAMFLDNECVALLTENPASEYMKNFYSMIYSQNTISDFLEYLNTLENSTTPEHVKKLQEVYGDSWNQPYTTLYMNNKSSD